MCEVDASAELAGVVAAALVDGLDDAERSALCAALAAGNERVLLRECPGGFELDIGGLRLAVDRSLPCDPSA